ncbi:hypothetical protein K461DRAFT_252568 [Myriangium duriaei CBS 260.36]|uniref:Uncharacterized protein n=1 Tax=Myriangium duriaei CBS 260.36 TaxID=1168546 RepID=A0A9P4MIQ6_9PEZI|nr:hypothetical protein K461DRAFT_252568 [Myriangium duriaei CBS 260.36]
MALSTAHLPQSITAATVTCSFVLVGNAITQSWMTIPTLLCRFPSPSDPAAYTERASILGEQWGMMHYVGNNFFRPISSVAVLGYSQAAYAAYAGSMKGDWRLFAFAAICHVANIVHSAKNLQPINAQLDAMVGTGEKGQAVVLAKRWIECNKWRVAFPMVAGSLALWQAFLLGL